MIAHIQFRHLGENIHSLLVFNFGAVKDVILVVPTEPLKGLSDEEKENGIVFTETTEGIWVCPEGTINQFPDTFSQLESAMLEYFNKDKFQFRRRYFA